MSDNLNAAEQVPAELWMNIFELMESPADLNAIVRTCRAFHRYGTRALHRTLIWRSPEDVVANLPLWDIDPGMYPGVKSLELRVSTVPDDVPATLVTRDGDLVRRGRAEEQRAVERGRIHRRELVEQRGELQGRERWRVVG